MDERLGALVTEVSLSLSTTTRLNGSQEQQQGDSEANNKGVQRRNLYS